MPPMPEVQRLPDSALAAKLPRDAVHQGIALLVDPLPEMTLSQFMAQLMEKIPAPSPRRQVVLALDKVTDPHNVGAILRSAAAFGARGVLITDRSSPREGGTLAKSASGALDLVPLVRVTNLSRAILQMRNEGDFFAYALASGASGASGENLKGAKGETAYKFGEAAIDSDRVLLALGAEGEGVRRLVRESCDAVVSIPTRDNFRELNVSNAAAIALFALAR
ncbi:MAG: RNA methyltransferase [Alphaproteobacteria bacterium]